MGAARTSAILPGVALSSACGSVPMPGGFQSPVARSSSRSSSRRASVRNGESGN
jgi:hypothetical protein